MLRSKFTPSRTRTGIIDLEDRYSIRLNYRGILRTPGIEPGLEPWKGAVLPLYYVRAGVEMFPFQLHQVGFEPTRLAPEDPSGKRNAFRLSLPP